MNRWAPPSFSVMHITTIPMTLFFFTEQIRYLQNRGVQFEAASSPDPDLEHFSQLSGIPCHPVPISRRLSPLSDAWSLAQLTALLHARRPDIVHSHTPKAGLLGTLAAALLGLSNRLFTLHGLPQMTRRGPAKILLDTTTRLTCRLARGVLCVSPSIRDYLIEHRLAPPDKVVVLGHGSVNGIDALGRFNPALYSAATNAALRTQYRIPPEALVIGFVGRIVADKGMRELVAAWRVIREELPAAHLLMVGAFEPTDPLAPEDEAVLRSDPRVHLAGWRRDIPEHLAIIDLLVTPSYREGFSVAHLEAAAMGKPVLATRIPGSIDSVVDGVTGTLVPPRNVPALTAALRRYLADPTLRAAHGTAGRQRVLRDFRPADLSEALLACYKNLLAAGSFSKSASRGSTFQPAPGSHPEPG